MAENNIGSMEAGNQEDPLKKFAVTPETPDGILDSKFTRYRNDEFETQYGYYIGVTDIQEVIDAKARWVIGKGYTADPQIKFILDGIRGYGKDTFNTIIENMVAMAEIGEDSYAQIIRDKQKNLINLKPLNTGRVTIVAGKDGLIDHYEYGGVTPVTKKKAVGFKRFEPEELFHLPRNRRGDEIHGRSMIVVLKTLIEAKQEAIVDYRTVMHRFVMPQWKFKLKTDSPGEIAAYKRKQDAATKRGDNIYEPMDVSESEILAVAPNATLNPIAWLNYLDAAFYKAAGVPQFIVGGGTGFTDSSEKIAYLAWQQTIEKYQLFIEEQVGQQLGMAIELSFPASLENELLSNQEKNGAENIDKSELNPASDNV
ncbi:hypothetical protein KAR91_74280 [Candidatus Pacearchaeota archaeon]|nr:hypothetical protein [Candidatus Pacearchaeota archaeon]